MLKKKKKEKQQMDDSETRVMEEGQTADPALQRYLRSVRQREMQRKAEEEKKATLMTQSEARGEQKDIAEELAIEKKRIQDDKERKQMRQRR